MGLAYLVDIMSTDHFYYLPTVQTSEPLKRCKNIYLSQLKGMSADSRSTDTPFKFHSKSKKNGIVHFSGNPFSPERKMSPERQFRASMFPNTSPNSGPADSPQTGLAESPNVQNAHEGGPKVTTATERPPPRPGQTISPWSSFGNAPNEPTIGQQHLIVNDEERGASRKQADGMEATALHGQYDNEFTQRKNHQTQEHHWQEKSENTKQDVNPNKPCDCNHGQNMNLFYRNTNEHWEGRNKHERSKNQLERYHGDVKFVASNQVLSTLPQLRPWLMLTGLSYAESVLSAAVLLPHFQDVVARYLVAASSVVIPLLFNCATVYNSLKDTRNNSDDHGNSVSEAQVMVSKPYSTQNLRSRSSRFLNTWFSSAGIYFLSCTTLPVVFLLWLLTKLYPYQQPKPKLYSSWMGFFCTLLGGLFFTASLLFGFQQYMKVSEAASSDPTSNNKEVSGTVDNAKED